MKLKGIRQRMHGWKRLRCIERCRYQNLMARTKRSRHRHSKSSTLWDTPFMLYPGDEKFASIVKERYRNLLVGDRTITCPKGSLILNLPEVLDFERNYEDSARTISIFRRALESGIRISYISFEKLKSVSPACTMAFASYADIWKQRAPAVHARCETWHPEVEQAFNQIGFFNMLNIPHSPVTVQQTNGRCYLPLKSCNIVTPEGRNVGSETKKIRVEIEDFIDRSLSEVRMYDSVTEAIYNVRNHAYKGMKPGRLPFRWWLSVSYDKTNSELGIIIFDHGYGIPATMGSSTKFARLKKILSRQDGGWSEHSRLYIAFERDRRKMGNVRSRIEGRGHGCQDIARLVLRGDQNQVKAGSRLSVISGRARYDFSGIGEAERGKSTALNFKLQGTLIEWKIKL